MTKKCKNMPDDKDIYLAFSTVFEGPNSEVRRQSVIKRLVHGSENRPEVAAFFRKSNNNALRGEIYERLKVLLDQKVFQSYSHAKSKFPGLFATSAAQSAERAASEAEAAVDHARAIEGALLAEQEAVDDTADDSDQTCTHSEDLQLLLGISSVPPVQECLAGPYLTNGPPIPPLFPMRFPFITGHKIIVEVQEILEQACFDFANHTMPEVLSTHGWDCAAAVELNIWVKVFRKRSKSFPKFASTNGQVNSTFYKSLCDIRHTAVHRLPVTAAGIEKCLRDGELLATILDDEAAAGRLSTMRCELQRVTAELDDHKCMLEAKLTRTLERIAAERAELERQEREAIDGMVRADKEYQLYASACLEQNLATSNADVTTASDDGSDGGVDTEDNIVDDGRCVAQRKTVDYFEDLNVLLALGIPSY